MTDSSSLAAICSDFYVNQKLALKLDLPTARESVLDLFDAAGGWHYLRSHRDPTDPHERVVEFELA